eukprot:2957235-Rhodomonas_salina.2
MSGSQLHTVCVLHAHIARAERADAERDAQKRGGTASRSPACSWLYAGAALPEEAKPPDIGGGVEVGVSALRRPHTHTHIF